MTESGSGRELRELALAAEILSPARFRLAGELFEAPPGELEERLAAELHRRYFQRRGAPAPPADRVAGWRFLAALSAAHGRRRVWQAGFEVVAAGPEEVVATRDGVAYWTHPRQVRATGGPLEPGQEVALRLPGELRHLHPGFFFALADDPAPGAPDGVLRLYWNLTPAGAIAWLAGLAERLAPAGLRWQAKVVRDPAAYGRADAAVLYLDPRDWPAARGPLRQLHLSLAGELGTAIPCLTRALAPGLGLAEGPEPRRSYGEESCRRVAGAVVAAGLAGGDPVRAVAAAFRALGRDPRRPHLAPGSAARYSLPPAGRRRPRVEATGTAPSFAVAALEIGRDLGRQAYFFEDRCNWVAPSPPRALGIASGEVALASLEPSLGHGLAGIALFLAELFLATGDAAAGRTARAAARQALRRIGEDPGPCPLGFFAGALGAAWAVRRIGAALGEAELVAGAEREIDPLLAAGFAEERRLDLAGGNAGAILVLLDLDRPAAAIRLGEEIGAIWPAAAEAAPGLAHGAAGRGLALLALHRITGDQKFLAAGRGALASEEARLDPNASWGEGAAGIALAGLKAMDLDPERAPHYETIARQALAATVAELERRATYPAADATSSHGLAGLAAVATAAARALGDNEFQAAAQRAMQAQIALHAAKGSWPSGLASREKTPVYLKGTAGIGHLLLRLAGHTKLPCPPLLDFL